MTAYRELAIKGGGQWIVTDTIFNIIVAYVQPSSPASALDTAVILDSLTPSKRRLVEGEKAEQPGSFLLEFWETFLCLAQQVPYDHPSQERLVQLVMELQSLENESVELNLFTILGNIVGASMWTHLERFDNVLADMWND
ncbi:hypothetical protein CLAIMM_14090 [Cladophialophora immunda]|nr:hypothetical protein CLAIMM_14090 [Cladophialophora immunda]